MLEKVLKLDEQQKKCLECRECCEYVEYPITMLSMEVVEYFLMRGEQMYIDPKNGVLSIRVYHPCIHLKKAGCDIYNNRPKTCRIYMCSEKDKSVKDHKKQICKESMAQIKQAIEDYKNKQAGG